MEMKTNIILDLSSAKAKGLRLKEIRKATYLGVTAFSQKYGFNYGTVQSWEHGLHGGLPPRRAYEIISALKNEGIICSFEWLVYGTGEKFYHINTSPAKAPLNNATDTEELHINNELTNFYQHYQEATHLTVADDALHPIYRIGDLVAGVKKYDKEIRKTINLDCIVQIIGEKELLLRNVRPGSEKEHYNLICLNPNTTTQLPLLCNVELLSAAPIIWLRRKN
jgi:HTH-type transcriptional regulator, cell division transcriptional repressor